MVLLAITKYLSSKNSEWKSTIIFAVGNSRHTVAVVHHTFLATKQAASRAHAILKNLFRTPTIASADHLTTESKPKGMPHCRDKWMLYNEPLYLLIHITRMLKPLDAVTKGRWTQKSMDSSHDEYNKWLWLSTKMCMCVVVLLFLLVPLSTAFICVRGQFILRYDRCMNEWAYSYRRIWNCHSNWLLL